ncbi:hypothetical protein PENTCL1PPCAC_20391, partial [Pristionchus entomophagus]
GWTSGTGGVHLINIIIHYIDSDWSYNEAVLSTKPVRGSQSAIAIAEIIQKEIDSADLEAHTAVTDGAAVMPAMCPILKTYGVACTSYNLLC